MFLEEGTSYLFQCTYMYIYIYIYICVCVCVCIGCPRRKGVIVSVILSKTFIWICVLFRTVSETAIWMYSGLAWAPSIVLPSRPAAPLSRILTFPPGTPYIYRVSQEECARLREGVPYVKVHRCNPKHLSPKLNGYGDNGQRKVWSSLGFHALYLSADSLINFRPWVWCHIMTHASSNCIPSGW
jgi:hypothetical protein